MRRTVYATLFLGGLVSCGRGQTAQAGSSTGAEASVGGDASAAKTSAQPNAPSPQPHPSTILFVGTSLTAGYGLDPDSAYPQLIQHMIDSAKLSYQVVNAGVSGETSSSLVRRMDWLLRQPFEVVIVETGANDGLRGIPIETMHANIRQIIERVKAARPRARIVLAQMEAPPNLGMSYTRRFRAVFPELANTHGIVLLPFMLEDVAGRRELNQADGIHPNMDGERIVARNVWKGLRPLLQ